MGRTKSWLALVLAIVMVLGMAIPTAFAADATVEPLAFAKDGTLVSISELTIDMGAKPVKVNLYNGVAGVAAGNELTEKAIGQKIVVTTEDVEASNIKVVPGDGFFTVEAVDLTAGTTFAVYAKHADGEPWKKDGWGVDDNPGYPNDMYFLGDFKVIVKPTATYTPKELSMDLQKSTVTHTLAPGEFAPLPANGKFAIASVQLPAGTVMTEQTVGDSVLLTAKTAGEYTIAVSYTVDKVAAVNPIKIPVHIGNSKDGVDYKLWTSKDAAGAVIKRNATDDARTFQIAVKDSKAETLRPKSGSPLTGTDANVDFTFVPESTTSVVSFDGTTDGVITTHIGDVAQTADTASTGNVRFNAEANLISAKGKIVVSNAGVLSTSFPIEITALNFNTKLATGAVTLDLDKGLAADSTKKVAYIYPESSDATAQLPLTNVTVFGDDKAKLDVQVDAATGKITIKANAATEKGTYTLKALGKVNGIWTEIKSFNVIVSDNTKVPVVGANQAAIDLDMNPDLSPKKDSLKVTLTASNFIDQAANVGDEKGKGIIAISKVTFDPALTAGTPELTNASGAAFSVADISRIVKTDTAEFTIKGAGRYVGKMTLEGKVNGIDFDKVTLNVTSANQKAGIRDHITSDVVDNKLNAKLGEAFKVINASIVDFGGNQVAGTFGTIAAVSDNLSVATVSPADINGKITISYVAAGTANITLTDSNAAPKAKSLTIKVTVGAMTFTVDPTSFVLDKMSEDASKVTLTLTSAEGGLSNIGATSTTPGLTITPDQSKKTIEVKLTDRTTAAVAKRQKVTVTANVNNKVATPVDITFEIKNTLVITPTQKSLNFELRDGGVRELPLNLTGNGNLVITSIEAQPTGFVTLVKGATTATTAAYNVVAGTAAGKGAIVVKGTVAGVAVEDVTIPFTVLGSDEKPLLTATPASVNLSLLEGGKITETLAITSDFGAVTGVVITATPNNLLTISGTTITAKASGTGNLTVNAKVAGIDAEPLTVPFTVLGNVNPVTGAGIYIDGVKYADGADLYIPNNWKKVPFKVTLVNADDTVIEDVTLKLTVASGKKARLKISGTSLVPTLYFGKTKLTVTPKLAGATGTTIELDVERKPEANSTPVLVTGLDNPQAGTRGYFFDYITSDPADAYFTQPKFWKFTSSSKSTANVKTNGIIEFKKAGTVTLKATKKSGTSNGSKISSFTLNLTVTDQYVNTASWAAVLSLSDKKADILNVYSSMVYPKGTNAQAFTQDKAGYEAMIAYLQSNAKANDVSSVYIDGDITKSGLRLGTTTITMAQLAKDLAQVPGKIFLTMNGAGSTFYSGKDVPATAADIAKVFSAAEASIKSKTPMSDAGTNMFWSSQKFYILSATSKKSQTSVTDAKAGVVEAEFIKAMTLTNGKFFNGSNIVTLKELYGQVRAESQKNIGYYPSSVSGVAVGYYMVPAVNP